MTARLYVMEKFRMLKLRQSSYYFYALRKNLLIQKSQLH